jgi:hypothetical protein
MSRPPLVRAESLPTGGTIDLTDLLYLDPPGSSQEKPPIDQAKRFFEYKQLPDESSIDFDLRRILDITVNYYGISKDKIETPIVPFEGSPSYPGLLIRLVSSAPNNAPLKLTLDFPPNVRDMELGPEVSGCRLAVMGEMNPAVGQVLIPDISLVLKDFFSVLPRICAVTPWMKSQGSSDLVHIYQSFLVGPDRLTYHFAADCISRFLDWAREEHSYT